MKFKIFIIVLTVQLLISCNSQSSNQRITKVNSDSLITHIDKYLDSDVEIEGTIVHICGVDGKKMKLKTDGGEIIKIIPQDSLKTFSKDLYNKRLKIHGIVKESRIENTLIDRIEQEKTLLCHIDNTPCKDAEWVNRQIEAGTADSLSDKTIKKLRAKMELTGKNYISIITILESDFEIIEE
jgi:hypothetical protein